MHNVFVYVQILFCYVHNVFRYVHNIFRYVHNVFCYVHNVFRYWHNVNFVMCICISLCAHVFRYVQNPFRYVQILKKLICKYCKRSCISINLSGTQNNSLYGPNGLSCRNVSRLCHVNFTLRAVLTPLYDVQTP